MRRPRCPCRLPRLLLLLAPLLISETLAVSLSDFQPISSSNAPCLKAYTQDIPSCAPADFTNGAPCSQTCIASLEKFNTVVMGACRGIQGPDDSLLGKVLDGSMVVTLCPNAKPAKANGGKEATGSGKTETRTASPIPAAPHSPSTTSTSKRTTSTTSTKPTPKPTSTSDVTKTSYKSPTQTSSTSTSTTTTPTPPPTTIKTATAPSPTSGPSGFPTTGPVIDTTSSVKLSPTGISNANDNGASSGGDGTPFGIADSGTGDGGGGGFGSAAARRSGRGSVALSLGAVGVLGLVQMLPF